MSWSYFKLKKIFLCGPFLKVFVGFVTILLLFFTFWFWESEAREILAPPPGIQPAVPVLEGEAPPTRPPGKSPWDFTSSEVRVGRPYGKPR